MKLHFFKQRRMLLAAICLTGTSLPLTSHAADLGAREIMEKNFYVSKIGSLKSDASMTLTNDKGQVRERKMSTLQKLQKNGIDSKLVMKFNAPADIKGIGFLQVEQSDAVDDQWIYLPALKKTRRLVANNKKESFMGSDFSYGDFSRPKVDWYRHQLLRSEKIEGQDCWLIESLPRDDTIKNDLGYSKKLQWVRKDNFLESQVQYFDLGGRLLKTQIATKHKMVDAAKERWFAMYREVNNHQTGHKTVLQFEQVQAGVPAPEEMFTTRTIERE